MPMLGWVAASSASIFQAVETFLITPNSFIGGPQIAAVDGWIFAALMIWELVIGKVIEGKDGRET
ncbi:MAG: hypothetical protein AB8B85_07875 [Paracoccaceae bacterium]